MAQSCLDPLPLYRPRDSHVSDLWRLIDEHFGTFQQVYDERFRARYGWQEQVFTLYLSQEKIEPEVVENMRSPEDDN